MAGMTRREFLGKGLKVAVGSGVAAAVGGWYLRNQRMRRAAIEKIERQLVSVPTAEVLATINHDIYNGRLQPAHLRAIDSVARSLGIHPARVFYQMENSGTDFAERARGEGQVFLNGLNREWGRLQGVGERERGSNFGRLDRQTRANLILYRGHFGRDKNAFINAHKAIEATEGSRWRLLKKYRDELDRGEPYPFPEKHK
ncbi:hypothetical protein HY991_04655 [Candidatus Micrarchaeota archaeon]|nr:hypothetical protein [Candidatus Micrarchaeota archaeon]